MNVSKYLDVLKATADKSTIIKLSNYAFKAAIHYRMAGNMALANEAKQLSDDIFNILYEAGYLKK